MTIIEFNLNQLYETKALASRIEAEKNDLIQEAIPTEVHAHISEITEEYDPVIRAADAEIFRLEKLIKEMVSARGETVRGTHLQAVFSKGRQSWDNDALDKYSESHPEILKFRKIGDPSVSIRLVEVKKNE